MYDGRSSRFPWFKVILGGISILVLVGSFGGFMWLLQTYVDPPRIAAGPSAASLLASVHSTRSDSARSASARSDQAESPAVMAARADVSTGHREPAPGLTSFAAAGVAPDHVPGITSNPRYERAPPPPNSGAPLPSWAGSPLPGAPRLHDVAGGPDAARSAPSAETDPGTVVLAGPVPLPRPKPRQAVRPRVPSTVVD